MVIHFDSAAVTVQEQSCNPVGQFGGIMSRPKTIVSLRLTGDSLIPAEITNLLGSQPSRAAVKGQNMGFGGSVSRAPTGVWLLKLENPEQDRLEDQILALLGKVSEDPDTWHHLSTVFSAEMFIGVFLSTINQGFDLPPNILHEVVKRKLRIAFDVYYTENPSS
jgi:hypothetical protein